MTELVDFANMTKEEIGDWFLSSDTSALMAASRVPTEPMVQVDERGVRVLPPTIRE